MVDALVDRLDGATVVEVGAGAGTALAEMVASGASRGVGIDISPHYEEAAGALLAERGVADRVEWHTGDFVVLESDLPAGDVVFLNRVVCCYPDLDGLVEAATRRPSWVALSHPRRRIWVRLLATVANTWLRMNRNSFRVHIHDPARIEALLGAAGFESAGRGRTTVWQWGVWARREAAV